MIILLPPSETKRSGGDGSPLNLSGLRFPELRSVREQTCADVISLCSDPVAAIRALKLGPTQSDSIARNLSLHTSPTLPALLRYTGVLYDALDAESLSEDQWSRASTMVVVQSALFGLISATDRVPDYRLSHDSRLDPTLKRRWSTPGNAVLESLSELIIDLRSESYAALSPLPIRSGAHYVRVVTADDNGRVRALNHFNKQAKGLFVRALLNAERDFFSAQHLLEWALDQRYHLTSMPDGTLSLRVPQVTGSPGKLRASLLSE